VEPVGKPLSTTQTLRGHSSNITRETYLHSVPADARAAVASVEKLIEDSKAESEMQSEPMGHKSHPIFPGSLGKLREHEQVLKTDRCKFLLVRRFSQ
jgi:hypothetical protein